MAIALTAMLRPGFGRALDGWMEIQIREAATTAYAILAADPEASSSSIGESVRAAIETWAVFQHDVYPALLALATMAALAVGWYFAGRHGEDYERPPAVREFSFRDELIWILVAGLMLLVLPFGGSAFRVGENATLFMVALYLARGGAILAWIATAAATSGWTWVFLAVGTVLAYPFVFGAALVLGVGDTWWHLRDRLAARLADRPGR
jgi:drug/metabolite transporter (DMT)-like permease